MNPKWRQIAPLGLYLALLAAVVAVGLYIVQRQFNLYIQICLGLFVIGLALFALLDPERVRRALTGRQARYGSNAFVLGIAFLGILVVANYLVFKNSKRWDLTENKENTLAKETLDTLKSLPEAVHAVGFYTPRVSSQTAKSLLDQYKFYSNGKFTYEFIDPEQNPVIAEQSKITTDGTVVLTMAGHQELVTSVTEQDMTGALVRLMSPSQSSVYFLTGHGEYSPEDTGDKSYSQVKRALESKNYVVKTLNLLAANLIPEDAKAIVIAGPRKPLSSGEVDLIKQFVDKGGGLIVMEEPLPVTDFGDAPDPMMDYLAQTWGIQLGMDMVIDTTSQQPFAPYAAQYGDHPITQKLQRTTSVYPSVRSVQAISSVTGISQVQLVLTAQQSWAETNLAGLKENPPQVQYDAGQDQMGPISLAVAAENFQSKGRVVVFGDSDFAIDVNYSAFANGDMLVNSVDWAVGQENLISLTPKTQTQRMVVPPQAAIMNLIMLGMVIVLPGLALVGGIVVFIQRRRRG